MELTKNLGLKKPAKNEYAKIETLNENADILDEKINEIEENMENLDTTWDGIKNKPETFPPEEHSHAYLKVYDNAGAHNAVYRGKYLGNAVTDAQYAAIAVGTFTDLYIGDYWTINGFNWYVAAFDYYLNCGNPRCTVHHVTIVPGTSLYSHVMNDSATTTGGYVGSKMYKSGLDQAKTIIKAAFGAHVLSRTVWLTHEVVNGTPSAGGWYTTEVDLMNEHMVYGSAIYMLSAASTTTAVNARVEKSQLPIFRQDPSKIVTGSAWALRDVSSADSFAIVQAHGQATRFAASTSFGVRPAFCIA